VWPLASVPRAGRAPPSCLPGCLSLGGCSRWRGGTKAFTILSATAVRLPAGEHVYCCVFCAVGGEPTTVSTRVLMAETDSLLKRLVSTCILDFASWLLGTAVQTARPLQSELPGSTVAVDQVFQVTLANDRELLLHLEFQGRRSREPMQWRM